MTTTTHQPAKRQALTELASEIRKRKAELAK